jgi:hypothetical protein
MLGRLRSRSGLNRGAIFAVVAALLLAGLPNVVVHAHAESHHDHSTAVEHDGDAGGQVPSGELHMHDLGVLGQTPVLPPALLSGVVADVRSVLPEAAAGIAADPFSASPFRPPAALILL